MWSKIISFIMGAIMFICSLFGISFPDKGEKDAIAYSCDKKSFSVTMEENATTGYRWNQTIADEGIVSLAKDEFNAPKAKCMVGAAGTRTFTFKAVAAGKTTIVLNYERSWESEPIETVTISVEVADDLTVTAQIAPVELPVGTDIEAIVAQYNKAANATKAYKGKMVITGKHGATTKITESSFPKAAITIANSMLPNDYAGDSRNYTVINGKTTDGKSIENILPIEGSPLMSNLQASGVQSAQCTKSGDSYKIQIKLKPESTKSFSVQPPNHKSCMDCLNLTDDDIAPFVCENCTINYQGGTITAAVNGDGLLTEFRVYNPIHITGTLKFSTIISGTAVIDASWRQELTIAY